MREKKEVTTATTSSKPDKVEELKKKVEELTAQNEKLTKDNKNLSTTLADSLDKVKKARAEIDEAMKRAEAAEASKLRAEARHEKILQENEELLALIEKLKEASGGVFMLDKTFEEGLHNAVSEYVATAREKAKEAEKERKAKAKAKAKSEADAQTIAELRELIGKLG